MILSRASFLSAILVFLVVCLLGVWLMQYKELPIITILSHREPHLALPVYAQFIVTQSLHMSEPSSITKFIVPMYVPDKNHSLTVRLLRNGKMIQEWGTSFNQTGLVETEFVLDQPALVDGTIEIQFDGITTSTNEKEVAPRLFTESADAAYPHGNYRIAQNEKQGDVSLTVFIQKNRLTLWRELWEENMGMALVGIMKLLFGFLVISTLPFLWLRK